MFFRRLNKRQPDRFVIAAAEMRYRTNPKTGKIGWYHSFLCLVNESHAAFSNKGVKEQVHIMSSSRSTCASPRNTYLSACTTLDMTPRDARRTDIFPLIGGKNEVVKEEWEDLKAFFKRVSGEFIKCENDFEYDPFKQNCRIVVRDALATKGIILHPKYTKSEAGLYAPPVFSTV